MKDFEIGQDNFMEQEKLIKPFPEVSQWCFKLLRRLLSLWSLCQLGRRVTVTLTWLLLVS